MWIRTRRKSWNTVNNLIISVSICLISIILLCENVSAASRRNSLRSKSRSRTLLSVSIKNSFHQDLNNNKTDDNLLLINNNPRGSRQIKPSPCTVEGSHYEGICMFVYDCHQAGGTHLGICRDRFYIGTCCKLPGMDEEDEQLLPETPSSSSTPPVIVGADDSDNEIVPKPQKITTTTTTTPEPSTSRSTTTQKPLVRPNLVHHNRTSLRDSDFFSENGTLLIRDPKLICGRQFLPASRIVGGSDAYYGKWPWQISVRTWQNDARTYVHACGAALINENWAISAAHCFERILNQDIILRLGDFDLSDENVPYTHLDRRVQLVIPHPKFFGPSKTFEYDLALIRFYEPVVFQPNIIPICIPDKQDNDFVGSYGVVTGWGRLYEGGPIPARLNEVQVPIMTNKECEAMFLRAGYLEKIPHIFMCAGWPEGTRDSCEGDSGGPLVHQTGLDNHWTLIGVISWGIGCARNSHPGVYTRISEFKDWINLVSEF